MQKKRRKERGKRGRMEGREVGRQAGRLKDQDTVTARKPPDTPLLLQRAPSLQLEEATRQMQTCQLVTVL